MISPDEAAKLSLQGMLFQIPKSSVSEERTAEYYKKRPCPKLCADSARIIAEYLNEVYMRSNGHN